MTTTPNTMMRVRGGTKDRLRALAGPRGWKMTEALERAVDALARELDAEGAGKHSQKRTPSVRAA